MKKRIVPNYTLLLIFAAGVALAVVSVNIFAALSDAVGTSTADNVVFGVIFAVFALLFAVGAPILMPHFFVFTKKSVRIVYIFLKCEEARWDEVKSVEVTGGNMLSYRITPMKGDRAFFIQSEIPVNFVTRRIMHSLWGEVEGDETFLGFVRGLHKGKKVPAKSAKARGAAARNAKKRKK